MPGKTKKAMPYGLGLTNKEYELDLPSGNQCLVRRPGAQGLIKAGLLDSLDSLTGLVQSELIDSKAPKKQLAAGAARLAGNMEKLGEGLSLVDRVICHVVAQPKVTMPPKDDDEREEDTLYADDVDMEDKMFIFQWVMGGTADLTSFRAESGELLESLSALQDITK